MSKRKRTAQTPAAKPKPGASLTPPHVQLVNATRPEPHNSQASSPDRQTLLEQELVQKDTTISGLQNQIVELQQQLTQQATEYTEQLKHYQLLQQHAETQRLTIAELRDQLALNASNPELDPQITALQRQLAEQEKTIATLQQDSTLQSHQASLIEPRSSDSRESPLENHAQSHAALEEVEQQAQVIADLRQQIAQLQRFASIGEIQVSKWRYRTFSS